LRAFTNRFTRWLTGSFAASIAAPTCSETVSAPERWRWG
jgi:hypothetical protein